MESLEKRVTQALPWDFRLVPAGGREDVVGFGGSGAYVVALEV
jgi:hypothetical protein